MPRDDDATAPPLDTAHVAPNHTRDASAPAFRETVRADAPEASFPGDPREEAISAQLPARYVDRGRIAGGTFGEVRRVLDTLLGRVVAMKVLRREHAKIPSVRRRFLMEASITAQLQHPGIVAVHDRGEMSTGQIWYTMMEVRGRTLHAVIEDLHAVSGPSGWGVTRDGWTFRRAVDAFSRIAQAMAHAHRLGVVHRDLKPANLMVGELGEVLVMDWGLARRMGVDDPRESDSRAAGEGESSSPRWTRFGDVLGTPAFMPPEQAAGETSRHGPWSDVYSLGAVLHCLLAGRSPYDGASAQEVLAALLSWPPPSVREAGRGGPPLPDELCAIVDKAMQREIEHRYPSAESLAADVVSWLDGARKREQALSALSRAQAFSPEVASLRARAAEVESRARALQRDLRPFDPIDKKRPAWDLEDVAKQLARSAALAEARWMEAVQGALSVDPDLPEAHEALADHHRDTLIEAERAGRDEDAARAEELLRIHDRGRNAAFLRGDGAVSIVTDPPGAEVIVERFRLVDRRKVPVHDRVIGPTPILEAPLQHGSYLLRIRAPGRVEVRYPVLIERAAHWDGRAPGESEASPILLPCEGDLDEDEVGIPAGWCWVFGDPEAPDSLPGKRVWIDAFLMRRFPVTTAEYLLFLNDLVLTGRGAEAVIACPKVHEGLAGGADEPALPRDRDGLFYLPADTDAMRWRPDFPISLVDWHAANAYAKWLSERTKRPYRLPDELEREKAARGADGRRFPWGDQAEPTFARVSDTSPEQAMCGSIESHPTDEGPYGVRGLAGNTRDWCMNVWRPHGPRIEGDRLVLEPADPADPDYRALKGGAWSGGMTQSRAAGRFGGRPGIRRRVVGIRLVRSWPVGR
ncbi:MAG: bifunctional serine/threonine-protein kinase/formylglycine-generating enzyme family protein [Polyangiaceae bacterium]